jgi:hypothetical protein
LRYCSREGATGSSPNPAAKRKLATGRIGRLGFWEGFNPRAGALSTETGQRSRTFFLDLLLEVPDVYGLVRGNVAGQHRRRRPPKTRRRGCEREKHLAAVRDVWVSDFSARSSAYRIWIWPRSRYKGLDGLYGYNGLSRHTVAFFGNIQLLICGPWTEVPYWALNCFS